MMTGFGMGFGLVGLLLMALFWGGLILLAVWFVKALFGTGNSSSNATRYPGTDAREILDQRYARGEITPEQYELIKQDLA